MTNENSARITVQLPPAEKDKIRDFAHSNGRSMSQEALHRLRTTYPTGTTPRKARKGK